MKESGVPLTKFKLNGNGLVTDIMLKDDKLLERIISMGICPGGRIKLINKVSNVLILETKNKKIALDKEIAKGIMVLGYEEF